MGCTASPKEPPLFEVSKKKESASTQRKRQSEIKHADKIEQPEKNPFHVKYVVDKRLRATGYNQIHLLSLAKTKSEKENSTLSAELLDDVRAAKIVDLRFKGPKLVRRIQHEIAIWKSLGRHQNCMCLLEVFFADALCYMVMDRCVSGLLSYLELVPVLDERSLGGIFAQMLSGIEHLHTSKIVHHDIAPPRFVVGGDEGRTVKLGDFGLAKRIPEAGFLSGECGSPTFMCPEMCVEQIYTEKADIWSFGVLVYALLFGNFPYQNEGETIAGATEKKDAEIKKAIGMATEPPEFRGPIEHSPNVVSFAMFLLARDPQQRVCARKARKLSYIALSAGDRHRPNDSLPCLRPLLQIAKRNKAFIHAPHADAPKKSAIDDLLNRLQIESHGIPVPQVTKESIVQSDITDRHRMAQSQRKGGSSMFHSKHSKRHSSSSGGSARHSTRSSESDLSAQTRRAGTDFSLERSSLLSGQTEDSFGTDLFLRTSMTVGTEDSPIESVVDAETAGRILESLPPPISTCDI